MAQQDQVNLIEYHGRWLTDAEIHLSKFFEQKHEERANELRAKKLEREIMARSSLTAAQLVSSLLQHISIIFVAVH